MKINLLSTPIARGFKCYHLASQQKIIISMFSYNSSLRQYMARMNKFPLLEPNQRLSLYSGKNQQQLCQTEAQVLILRSMIYKIIILSSVLVCSARGLKSNPSSFPTMCLTFFSILSIYLIYSVFICIQPFTLFPSSWFIHLSHNAHLLLPHLHHSLFLTLSLLCDRNCSCLTKSVSNSIQLSRFNCFVWTLKQFKSG